MTETPLRDQFAMAPSGWRWQEYDHPEDPYIFGEDRPKQIENQANVTPLYDIDAILGVIEARLRVYEGARGRSDPWDKGVTMNDYQMFSHTIEALTIVHECLERQKPKANEGAEK